jgi:hypothetical protein
MTIYYNKMDNAIYNLAKGGYQASRATANALATAAVLTDRAVRRGKQRKPETAGRARTISVTRNSVLANYTLTAGSSSGKSDLLLSSFPFTDLLGTFDRYRVNWAEFVVFPTYDAGQSGVTNNANILVALANDPGGHLTAPTMQDISQFDNCKIEPMVSGKVIRYRWSPKPTNALSAGNLASSNDWLYTGTGGDAIPHLRLLYNFQSNAAAATTAGVSGYVRINVTFKGLY